ncbi:MAG TPA: hypothetical protein VM095_15910 [Pyrinomonadaceae bacterium]|nr:hypothetical protein [Pyrinomonadaceae bacterium]
MSEIPKKLDRRVKTMEEAVQILTQMALRADERMDSTDQRMDGIDSVLINLTVKIEALADAQIHTEESLNRLSDSHKQLAEAQAKLAEAQANLAESQTHTNQRLDALIDIVREEREGRKEQEE